MAKVYILLAEGFEEVEALATADVLIRSGIEALLVSVYGEKTVRGSHGIEIVTDLQFENAEHFDRNVFFDADAVILPGGKKGTDNLGANGAVCEMIKAYDEAGKLVCAICAAPSVLGANGILKGHEATCFPGFEGMLEGAVYKDVPAVLSGNVITGRSMGTAIDFGLMISEYLAGKDVSEKTAYNLHR